MTIIRNIDLNVDLGEMPDAKDRDIAILSVVSSANIACGGHAGDEKSMRLMIKYAKENKVRIGAHPSYPDKKNFGRKSMDIKAEELSHSLSNQITTIMHIAKEETAHISYVKPHGALYNDAMDNDDLSHILVSIVKNINPSLAIMGMAQSALEKVAIDSGLDFIEEAFIDRAYTAQARLQNRSIKDAVITDYELQFQQALSIARGKSIIAEGKEIYIKAKSLCMHSDSDGALENSKKLRKMLLKNNIMIKACHG